ncbi:hypothetical protein [Parasitella parasitica]|uniref:Uncharacterized protein n=1 Tax=Parasitella parasitica TaxID=35722 RepID=A0A0B7NTI5_9FUNG|nr:hypothetical protein [Parasitella parasitica]
MSPVNQHHNNMTIYYNQQQAHQQAYHFHRQQVQQHNTSPSFSHSKAPRNSPERLGQIRAQLELARNFYDDFEFCPVQCSSEVLEHRDRIQQRLSPQSSPSTSPSMTSASSLGSTTPPKSKRAIPIIDPSNMAPVSVPPQQYNTMKNTSPILHQQQYMLSGNTRSYHHHQQQMNGSYHDVLVQ